MLYRALLAHLCVSREHLVVHSTQYLLPLQQKLLFRFSLYPLGFIFQGQEHNSNTKRTSEIRVPSKNILSQHIIKTHRKIECLSHVAPAKVTVVHEWALLPRTHPNPDSLSGVAAMQLQRTLLYGNPAALLTYEIPMCAHKIRKQGICLYLAWLFLPKFYSALIKILYNPLKRRTL